MHESVELESREAFILQEMDKIQQSLNQRLETIQTNMTPTVSINNVLLTDANIQKRIEELADSLYADYQGKNPIFVCVLTGGASFAHDLFKAFEKRKLKFDVDYISVSSYQGTSSTGTITYRLKSTLVYTNRYIVPVDDVGETMLTLSTTIEDFKKRKPIDVKSVVLVDKKDTTITDRKNPDYVGFSVAKEHFLVGKGMDVLESLRTLPGIYTVAEGTAPTKDELHDYKRLVELQKELEELNSLEQESNLAISEVSSTSCTNGSASRMTLSYNSLWKEADVDQKEEMRKDMSYIQCCMPS